MSPRPESRFVMDRTTPRSGQRRALETGKTVRERGWVGGMGWVLYVPVRIKPRYWTSQVNGASVIHIATGRGVRTQGASGCDGEITVEPHCYGHVEWPRALSSPDDLPARRLCPSCVEKAHGIGDTIPGGDITVVGRSR